MDERRAYMALNMMEKVGPVTVRSLVEVLGSAAAIFDADKSDLMKAKGVGLDLAETILRNRERIDLDRELADAEAIGAHIVTQVDKEYPEHLLEIHDPPLAVYVWGSFQSKDKQSVAIVGTRRPSHYGRETAERLAYQLSKAGFVIISGLALGIDTAGHEGALKAKGRTLAVIGGGLDCIYPAANKDLAKQIAEQGAVISEYPLGRQPDKTTFPVRNRIVSGLSMGVLVVEAGRQSGALITAHQAADHGRPVFAVPGRIDSPTSQGCHDLIKQGAKLVDSVDDILQEYEFLFPAPAAMRRQERTKPEMSEDEASIMRCLDGGALDLDALIRASGLSAAAVTSLLLGLEMKRLIRMLPGHMVEPRQDSGVD